MPATAEKFRRERPVDRHAALPRPERAGAEPTRGRTPAVAPFRTGAGLTADGIVGPLTWQALLA